MTDSRLDDADIQHMAEPMLDRDVGVDVIAEWITIGQDARKRQEDAGHSDAWITDRPGHGCKPAQREPRCGHQGVGEKHPNKNHVDEKPFHAAFVGREGLVSQIAFDDAGVVGAVPVARGGSPDEVEVCSDRGAAGLAGMAEGERAGFGGVAQQRFVQRPPPRAAWPWIALWVQKPPAQLPTHEGGCRPPVRKISTINASWDFVEPTHKRQPFHWVVPDALDG